MRVDSRSAWAGPTRPESKVTSSRSYRSEIAFHSAIDTSMSRLKLSRSLEASAAESSPSSSCLRRSRHTPRSRR